MGGGGRAEREAGKYRLVPHHQIDLDKARHGTSSKKKNPNRQIL
jgi:hypothetical protein